MLLKNLVTISGDHCQPTTGHPNGDTGWFFPACPASPACPDCRQAGDKRDAAASLKNQKRLLLVGTAGLEPAAFSV